MHFARRVVTCLILVLATFVALPRARSDERTHAAELAFDEGKRLMEAEDYARACPALEASVALDDALGARFMLAECYEHQGRVASAYKSYQQVSDRARADGQTERADFAAERALTVKARVPSVALVVGPEVRALPDVVVLHNEQPLSFDAAAKPTPLDPGEHRFEVRAPGRTSWVRVLAIQPDGRTTTLEVTELRMLGSSVEPADSPDTTPTPQPAASSSVSRLAITGLVLGGVGLVGIGVGVGLAVSAKADYDAALAEFCVEKRCPQQGVLATQDARDQGTVATVVFAVGAGAAATGVLLTVLGFVLDDPAPAQGLVVAPSHDGVLVGYLGTF